MDRDALFELSIAEDAMSVTASFLPAIGSGRVLEREVVETILETHGVFEGIDWELVNEQIFEVNTQRRAREDVVIAHGTLPTATRPAYYRLVEPAPEAPEPFTDSFGRVDFKQASRLQIVRAGQVVAHHIPERAGVPGTTVRGDELPPTTEKVPAIVPGANTRENEDGTVVAEIGGQVVTRSNAFHIEDRLEISGEVGYATGSIEFPGDVVLKGEVKEGFHIWAGGTITATATIDVSQIYCRGDFSSAGGLIGRGKALLRSGGSVQVRFIGNSYVESKKAVFVKQYAYMSHIGCLDRFATADKGRIIGGVVTAVNGVRCSSLGNSAAVTTVVRVGIDFIAERKLRIATEKLQSLTLKSQKLAGRLGDHPTDRQVDIVHRIEEARRDLALDMGELAIGLDANESAEVVVNGTIFPGAVIQICRATYRVTTPMKKMRFLLDKAIGQVVSRSLSAES